MTQLTPASNMNTALPANPAALRPLRAEALQPTEAAQKTAGAGLQDNQLEPLPGRQSLAKMRFYQPAERSSASPWVTPGRGGDSTSAADGAAPVAENTQKEGVLAGVAQGSKAEEPEDCKTCERRQYQDGSDDSGVSFQTAKHIPAATAAISVASHEGEHVTRESAKAADEGRMVLKKTVTFQMAFCPECHKMYVAGGTTSMTTAAAGQSEQGKNGKASVFSALDWLDPAGEEMDTYA